MARKRYSAGQITGKLREAEILLAKGQKAGQVSRTLGITDQTYYRWRKEYGGLKVPRKQPKRGRLWLGDGSRVRLPPTHRNHVWSYDFVADRTHDGRALKMLTVIGECERDSLDIVTRRRIRSDDVLHCLADLFLMRGIPDYIRSDKGLSLRPRWSTTSSGLTAL